MCDTTRYGGNVGIPSVAGLYGNTISYPLPGPAGLSTLAACTLGNLDTTMLVQGQSYKMCLDLDGQSLKRAMGDTGFKVYIHYQEIENRIRIKFKLLERHFLIHYHFYSKNDIRINDFNASYGGP